MNFVQPTDATPTSVTRRPVIFWCLIVVSGGLFLLGLTIGGAMTYQRLYQDRIFSGVRVMGQNVGGLTREQVTQMLDKQAEQIITHGLTYTFAGRTISLPVASRVSDDSSAGMRLQLEQMMNRAWEQGREAPSLWRNSITRLGLRLKATNLEPALEIDDQRLRLALADAFVGTTEEPRDAAFKLEFADPLKAPTISITPEKTGRTMNLDETLRLTRTHLAGLDATAISIPEINAQPARTERDIQTALSTLPTWLAHAPLRLNAEGKTWTVNAPTLASWLDVTTSTGVFALTLAPERFQTSVETLIENILQKPKNGLLDIEGEEPLPGSVSGTQFAPLPGLKLKDFTAPAAGRVLDVTASLQNLEDGWAHGSSTIPLTIKTEVPAILGEDAERLGIVETIGIGRSSFAGSPRNRRKNIALGASKVHGTLIPPGYTFSLLKTLGQINTSSGWLPELVIKGDKTTPELGGGLCQIGTTAFRAALGSGLPITQRQNHSYRVTYYEPAGTDATIYDPAPDFRFKNDTEHWVLITAEQKGDDLAFVFWGTKDGRVAVQTPPRIYNIAAPPPKKIIETTSLAPGQTKCTEKAHAGADASFDYTVTSASGETKKVTFKSHYKPWGAVCLLGVKQVTEPTVANEPVVDQTGINNPN